MKLYLHTKSISYHVFYIPNSFRTSSVTAPHNVQSFAALSNFWIFTYAKFFQTVMAFHNFRFSVALSNFWISTISPYPCYEYFTILLFFYLKNFKQLSVDNFHVPNSFRILTVMSLHNFQFSVAQSNFRIFTNSPCSEQFTIS